MYYLFLFITPEAEVHSNPALKDFEFKRSMKVIGICFRRNFVLVKKEKMNWGIKDLYLLSPEFRYSRVLKSGARL